MGKVLREIFTGTSGDLSSKRIIGAISFLAALVTYVAHAFIGGFPLEIEMFNSFLIFSASCLGISELGKFAPTTQQTSKSEKEIL